MQRKWLLLTIALCGVAAADVSPEFLIRDYRVGLVSTRMTPEQAAKQYPPARVKRWAPYPRVQVIDIDPASTPGAEPAIRMHLDRDQKSIWLIAISDPRYKTAKGIGIGSTFGALRRAHPRLKIQMQEGEMDRLIVAEIPGEGITFLLQFDEATWQKMRGQSNSQNVPISIIPDDKSIQSVSIVRPPTP